MKTVAQEHPELFHYTSSAGLLGIIQNQSLWAGHYSYSNDVQEIQHFFDFGLPELLPATTPETIKKLKAILFNETEPLAEPYLVSFCTPLNRDENIRNHGLLSQWRGYASEGGFAIVFDTQKLSTLLEALGHQWGDDADLFLGDIVYSSDDKSRQIQEYGDDLKIIEQFCTATAQLPDEILEKLFMAFMRCACRYKHWGFKEENEVRIVAIPQGKAIHRRAKSEGIKINMIPQKFYQRSGILVPYIDLFENLSKDKKAALPITRIIVGPCKTEQEQKNKIVSTKILLNQHGITATVVASEIPYRK